jgi:S1-C subfamily serine protease
VNASVNLLARASRANVHIEASVPPDHPTALLLGTERAGSGTIIEETGIILTANYVVLGARHVKVFLYDGTELTAAVAAQDGVSGLAVLRVPAAALLTVPLQTAVPPQVGDEVFVVSSIGEGGSRVADGNITYVGPFEANWEYCLDLAIMASALNPGLGGGALIDRFGAAIGVVSLSINVVGRFSLAVPIQSFLEVRDELLTNGRRAAAIGRAWLGLFCYALQGHVIVAGLLPGAPADRAGLKQGDVILKIDDHEVADRRTLYQQLWTHTAGDAVRLKVFRDNEVSVVDVSTVDAEDFLG